MGYSAQVQQSPGQYSSGKSGPVGQLAQQVDIAPRSPDQPLPVGISQQDQGGFDSGAPHQTRTDGLDQNAINANPQGFAQWQQQRSQQPMGKGGAITNSATSGQPRVGQPNMYPNTVGMGDNSQQQPNQAQAKGKGA
jgi:hypothetical protein